MDHGTYKRSDFLVRRRRDHLQHSRLAFFIQSEGTRQSCHQPLLCVSTIYVISISAHSIHVYICSPYMYILLCRKKVMECMKGGPFDIGFIDPNRVHEQGVRDKPGQTEDYLLKSLPR